jgi:hypothetical protein
MKNENVSLVDYSEAIKSVISEKHKTSKSVMFAPNIPPKKIQTAINKYANNLQPYEEILILGEYIGFLMMNFGFIITNFNFYFFGLDAKNDLASSVTGMVPLKDIKSIVFDDNLIKDNSFTLNGGEVITPKYFELAAKDREFLVKVFNVIVEGNPALRKNVLPDDLINTSIGNKGNQVSVNTPPQSGPVSIKHTSIWGSKMPFWLQILLIALVVFLGLLFEKLFKL